MQEKPPRAFTDRELAYERIVGEWEEWVDLYDTKRGVETLVNDFL